MKTIYFVSGEPSSGKTTSIREAYMLFLNDEAAKPTKFFKFIGGSDFTSILVHGETSIGFISQGDKCKQIEDLLQEILKKNCSIIICAIRETLIEKFIDEEKKYNGYDINLDLKPMKSLKGKLTKNKDKITREQSEKIYKKITEVLHV